MFLRFGTILKKMYVINFDDAAGLKPEILRLSKQKKVNCNLFHF